MEEKLFQPEDFSFLWKKKNILRAPFDDIYW